MKAILSFLSVWALVSVSCANTRAVPTSTARISEPAVDPSQIVFIVGVAHTSRPVAGVRVSLLGADGIEVELGTTDDFGRLRVPKTLLQTHLVRLILFSKEGFFTGAWRFDSGDDYNSATHRYIELAPFTVI